MKNNFLHSFQSEVNVMDPLIAEMAIEKALLDFKIKKIQQKIDQSLKDRNKKEFIRLTNELKNIS
jgi:uncharacterized protein YpiB (UPF0302 family)